ncbi:MAG: Fic family protein [Gemmatimonadota bacterium]|nr:Fic family protein [Gemmatimonadota bacterium]
MRHNCPITGDTAKVVESVDRIIVEHSKLGRYTLDTNAFSELEVDAGGRERIAHWITESRSLGIDIPNLTLEYVHLFERLANLETAIAEWHERREGMKSADYERVWRKLRLEWNYNSNHIEGNTLTYHETELLLIHGRTAGGHPMRDYEEMKAHDVAIDYTRSLAGEERIIGESDIRQLNQILLKEPFWSYAETPDGQPTQKRIVPGQYKTQPNHVRTATGELHRYAEPEETPQLMEEWTRGFRRDLERSAYPLPLFLAESHWSFLCIHPFDDGNGRTARLLANYALLRNNLPPIVIKSEDRDRYIGGLQNADVGRMLPLAEFMLENVLWSLQLGIRAAKGESIREPDDVDKEMDVFIQKRRVPAPNNSDVEVLDQIVLQYVKPILEKLDRLCERQGSELFSRYVPRKYARLGSSGGVSGDVFGVDQWGSTKEKYLLSPGFELSDEQQVELGANYRFYRYRGIGNHGFDLELSVVWKLSGEKFSFEAAINGKHITDINRHIPYSELDSQDAELDHTVDRICKAMMDEIDSRSQRSE